MLAEGLSPADFRAPVPGFLSGSGDGWKRGLGPTRGPWVLFSTVALGIVPASVRGAGLNLGYDLGYSCTVARTCSRTPSCARTCVGCSGACIC